MKRNVIKFQDLSDPGNFCFYCFNQCFSAQTDRHKTQFVFQTITIETKKQQKQENIELPQVSGSR